MYKRQDAAIARGTNKPDSWPDGLVTQAINSGNAVTLGAGEDIYDDILSENGVFAKVESDGYIVSAAMGAVPLKSCLLYTSDAADDLPCVDLGGRRIS